MKPLLIVDDREDDRFLLERSLWQAGIENSILSFANGAQLISYLSGPGLYIGRRSYPCPVIMFLDLDMPQTNGFEVMAWLQARKRSEEFFVVVTTVLKNNDIRTAYALGARSYLSKPVQQQEVVNLVNYYPAFWETSERGHEPARAG
jgi:CheY-like chemotaxis protein